MKILMLTQSFIPNDVRVWQEAKLLKRNGHIVTIIALKEKSQLYFETIDKIRIYRIPDIELFKYGKHDASENRSILFSIFFKIKAIIGYGFEFSYFTFISFLISILILIKHNFNIIHTHNPPDTLFLVAGFYKLFGKRFIFDHHDLAPDLYLEKYKSKKNMIYYILLYLEKISCRIADIVIATNESYKEIEQNRCNINPDKIFIVRNGPDLKRIKRSNAIPNLENNNKIKLCYLGVINKQDGVDYLLDVLHKIIFKYKYLSIQLLIIGDGDYLFKIKELSKDLAVENFIIFTGLISDSNLLNEYLSTADIFVDTAPYSFLNDNSTFIKHMEYMVFKKPIVSFHLKENAFSLKDAGLLINPNDTDLMAKSIIDLINNKELTEKLSFNAEKRVQELTWDKVSVPLLDAYNEISNLYFR